MPKLVIFRGDAVESEVRLAGGTVRIGRHNRNDIVLDDSLNGVSRFHAEIRAEAGTYFIVDMNSRNGVWINGKRIKEKAALALGVPVTVGAFELALEDDASTGEFDEPLVNPHTKSATVVAAKAAASRPGAAARSQATKAPAAMNQRQVLLWSGSAVIVLLICAIPFAVVYYRNRPAPAVAAVVEPPPVVVETPPPPPPEPPEDPNKKAIDQHLIDARAQMQAGDFAAALRDHLQPVLELQPENPDAVELKKQADEAVNAAAAQAAAAVQKPVRAPRPEPTEVETPGIARRSSEAYADYLSRVKRVQIAFNEGKASLDKQEFGAAISHFRAVERDQPRYPGVDVLIARAQSDQQKALEEAISSGQQNEQAGKLKIARQWYQRALEIDPGSTSAREKNQALVSRMTAEANRLFDRATLAVKLGDREAALRQFQQILDLMSPGDEISQRAAKQMEGLKR